jgi:hypothetical protein
MRYITLFIVVFSLGLIAPTLHASENTVDIDVYILSGPHVLSPKIKVTNMGESDIHDVRITDVSVEGNILYNNRESLLTDGLEPGEYTLGQPNSLFLGYGIFSMNITVECDEGTCTTDETNGFIIGWFFLIP